ncbi:MAG: chromate transporter, chromate ion transporter family [Myxococcaceae bacterium]|nr:chromate transporter, chromate ion transporter family [Myxococcaceae bacterium]
MRELALVFLKLGTTAFGGPAAHIAMMEDELVRRRAWLTREELLDLVSAAALIPGPSSTEVAIYIGYRRGGWRGLLLGGLCFIMPAALIVTAIAWAYVRFGRLPAVGGVLYGIKAIIIAVVAQALVAFGRTAIKSRWLLALGVAAAAANVLGASPLVVLLCAGVVSAAGPIVRHEKKEKNDPSLLWPGALGVTSGASIVATASAPVGLTKLFLVFLKIGAIVFGSGYVLLAFLRADLVDRTHWLTESQLVDAVAVGQLTPGPVFTTATFVGYVVAGIPGAIVATVGIFLPSFVLVAISGRLIPRLRRSRIAGAFLDGVNVASLALMGVVGVQLARAAIVDVPSAGLAVLSGAALLRWRINSAWLVLAGGAVGALVQWLR